MVRCREAFEAVLRPVSFLTLLGIVFFSLDTGFLVLTLFLLQAED